LRPRRGLAARHRRRLGGADHAAGAASFSAFFAASFAVHDGPREVVDLLEQLAETRGPRLTTGDHTRSPTR